MFIVNSASGVSSLPVYGGGHQRDSRILQIEVIPAHEIAIPASSVPRSQIRGRSITNLNGFVDQQRSGAQRRVSTRKFHDGPLNLDDKDHILFPDQFEQLQQLGVAKDSYGNPVTPFPLSNDELKLRAGSYKVDKSGFVIPSYADGITDVHDPHLPRVAKKPNANILPPLSSGNFYYPGVKPQASTDSIFVDRTDASANELPQPPQLPTIPDIGSNSQATVIEIPSDTLLPPLEHDEFESQYNQPIVSNVPVPQQDVLPSFQQQQPRPTQSPTQPGVQFTLASHQPIIVPFAPTSRPTQVQTNPTLTTFTTASGDRYTGGFGFANGQKPTNVFITTVDDSNKYQGGFTQPSNSIPPRIPQLSGSLQAPPTPTSNNKYTSAPTQPPTLPPTIKPQFDDNRYAGSFQTPTQTIVTTTVDKGDKYTGGFGYGGNTNAQLQAQPIAAPSQQINQFPTPVVSKNDGQKYTGGFGGPPGILVPFDHIHSKSLLINL